MALNTLDSGNSIRVAFEAIPKKWQRTINNELDNLGEKHLLIF